ncbi:hypothetical protein Taro_015329 [Colocasia esculenta]|uniref:C2H2-type domain-containing protein n=1 Tax=Colocasia esculenta TaxID=4460 RepID=A0A843UH34_COLES|nr:hypothetical protein [Colocasia esculenta]
MEGFRAGEDGMERVNMADVLQLLLPRPGNISRDHGAIGVRDRGFKCKTCNRRFPTFQALGGHSTSHRKPKPAVGGGSVGEAKPKVHGCSICGLEFAMGQALGGHMRRHRGEAEAAAPQRLCTQKPSPLADGLVCLDLNQLPPSTEEEEDMELLTLGLGIRDHMIPEKVPVVGCMGCSEMFT